MDKSLRTASLLLVIAGLLSLAGGVAGKIYQNYKEAGKGRVTARVVDLVLKETENADPALPIKTAIIRCLNITPAAAV